MDFNYLFVRKWFTALVGYTDVQYWAETVIAFQKCCSLTLIISMMDKYTQVPKSKKKRIPMDKQQYRKLF